MYPSDLPTPPDVRASGPGCPDCGSQWGDPALAHGVPAHATVTPDGEGWSEGDRSLAGLLCSVRAVARYLVEGIEGDEADPEYLSDLLGQALGRFLGE